MGKLHVAVVDVVVALAAHEHEVVDVGAAVSVPWVDVVGFAPVDGAVASGAALVACDEGFPLCGGGVSAGRPTQMGRAVRRR